MIARVREVIRDSIALTSMFHVSASQSTTTGTPPSRDTAAAQEMIVNVGMMTSSPGPMSSAAAAASSAAALDIGPVADGNAVPAPYALGKPRLEFANERAFG
jgi:hypothetical protein